MLIEAAQEVRPDFLRTLSERVFPLYARLAKDEYGEIKSTDDWNRLEGAISKWAASFHADRDWIREGARDTLKLWETPRYRKALRWGPTGVTVRGKSNPEEFSFRYTPWLPSFWTWADYRKSARARFEKSLAAYESRVRISTESAGRRRARRTYSPEHIKWLALHEFAGLSHRKIAKLEARDQHVADPTDRIRKGIKAAADLVGWGPLRNTPGK